jgi:mono/diheme cytochrome c family protein
MASRLRLIPWLLFAAASVARGDGGATPTAPVDFARDIKPVLEARCVSCHGPAKQRGGFRLDRKSDALKGGDSGPAIRPGKSNNSPLLQRISSVVKSERMPPTGERLSNAQVAVLRAWIDQGALWPDSMTAEEQTHWAFLPVVRPAVPQVAGTTWQEHPIDAFITARLEKEKLAPNPEADRVTLLRRLKFDLLGLPPTPEEIEAFTTDRDPQALEKLVDRYLASPHYGERWARHWLDVVRFAESDGFEMNQPRPNAWPYRDYVIRALNEDRPFDRFVCEQLAGDALGVDEATAFLVAGPADKVKSPDIVLTLQQRADELHDMVSTTSSAFLGLTVGCARCHNHKFDPISQSDYYAFKAVFAGVQHGERAVRPADTSERTTPKTMYAGRFTPPERIHRLHRGDPMQQREEVAAAGLSSFGPRMQLALDAPEAQRRLALAQWITDPRHPLTARVLVNRLWQYHFGTGLVSTPSDFGRNGARPSHPELLDWLASDFVAGGWKLKRMHRLIVLSRTYRQASTANAQGLAADAGCRLLWRYPPRRLEAEPLRDAMLAVSGKLDLRAGGPGFDLFEPNTNYVKVYTPKKEFGPPEWRRMIYQTKPRMQLDDTFGAFDCPDAGQIAPKRNRSTTALQAFNLFNSRFTLQQAGFLAQRLQKEAGDDARAQVQHGFRLAFQRVATEEEVTAATALVHEHGLAAFCRALFNANEFLYVF